MNKIAIFMMLLLSVLNYSCASEQNVNAQGLKKIKVKTGKLQAKELEEKISALGNITASKEVAVTAEVNGKIIKIFKEEGDLVKAGELLALVQKEPFEMAVRKAQLQVNQAEASLSLARNNYNEAMLAIEKKFHEIEKSRIQKEQAKLESEENERDFKNKQILFEKEGISKSAYKKLEVQLQESRARYELSLRNYETESVGFRDKDLREAFGQVPTDKDERIKKIKELRTQTEKAKLEMAYNERLKSKIELEEGQLYLSKCYIYAPISGVIGLKKIQEGELLQKDAPLFVLFLTANVYGEFEIGEDQIGKLNLKDKVQFSADAFPGKIFTGFVQVINPLISQKTRTGIVRVQTANTKQELRVGMFIRGVFFTGNTKKSLLLSEKAVIGMKGDKGEVFTVQNGYVVRKSVLVESEKQGDLFVVKEGLTVEDTIILSAVGEIAEGMAVEN